MPPPPASPDVPPAPRVFSRYWWPIAGVAVLVFAIVSVTRADPDLWGHVQFGLDTLDTWRLPADDPYSFTQDRPWLNHEWLSELIMGAAYGLAGTAGLVVLKGALLSATLLVVWPAFRGASPAARISMLVLAALASIHMTFSLRPQLWTFLCLAVECRLLADVTGRSRRWLPVLFIVWVNVHGGWVVGIAVLAAWSLADSLTRHSAWRQWAVLVPATIGATLLNPYGPGLWRFVIETVRPDREILEWLPMFESSPIFWVPWVIVVGVSLVLLPVLKRCRWPVAAVLVLLGTQAWEVVRMGSLYALAATILLAPAVAAWFPVRRARRTPPGSRSELWAAAYLFLLPAGIGAWILASSTTCVPVGGSRAPDQVVASALGAAAPGRLVTFFDWGQYALWHFGPAIKVSMDGRRETVYSEARLADHDDILQGTPRGLALLEEWRPDYVWLPSSSRVTREWLEENGYRIDVTSDRSFLAVRTDRPVLRAAEFETASPRCFPD